MQGVPLRIALQRIAQGAAPGCQQRRHSVGSEKGLSAPFPVGFRRGIKFFQTGKRRCDPG